MPLSETQLETYTSFDVSLNAKGLVQWEVKTKYATTEKSEEELAKAIDSIRNVLKEKGLTEAGAQ